MGSPREDLPRSFEEAQAFLSEAEQFSQVELARKYRLSRGGIQTRIERCKRIVQEIPAFVAEKPRIRVPAGSNKQVKVLRVGYYTDAHNDLKLSKDRFVWLAKFFNDEQPDAIVDGGDFDDFTSLCAHVRDDTQKGRLKPSLQKELENSEEAHRLFSETLTIDVPKYKTLGNHEARIDHYEDQNPAMFGIASGIYRDILSRYGWRVTEYKDYLNLEGVDFTHVPMNGLNQAVGGARIVVNVAVKSVKDVCFGHTHVMGLHTEPKCGQNIGVTAFNGGGYMPYGYIPDYAKGSQKQPWHGAHIITIAEGRIRSVSSISILDLEHKYG